MVKYLALLLVLSNYVQCQSQLQKESIHPDNLNFLNNAYKLHITNQQSQLLNEYKIDKRALILNSRSLDSPYNHYLKNYCYHNPLIFDWMEIRYKKNIDISMIQEMSMVIVPTLGLHLVTDSLIAVIYHIIRIKPRSPGVF